MLSMIPDSPIDYVSGQKPNTEVETRYCFTSIFSVLSHCCRTFNLQITHKFIGHLSFYSLGIINSLIGERSVTQRWEVGWLRFECMNLFSQATLHYQCFCDHSEHFGW